MSVRLFLVPALAAVLVGCAARTPNIAQLKVDPARFHDKTVQIEGVVTQTADSPLPSGTVYKVDDGSGEITVISSNPVALPRGARVRVTGTLEGRASREGSSVGLHVQERSLDVRPTSGSS